MNSDAMPRKLKKPATSVTVVNMMEEDCAGSWPSLFNKRGIAAPAIPAIAMDSIIAMPITAVSPNDLLQTKTASEVVTETANPLMTATSVSFATTRCQCALETDPDKLL